MSRRSSAWAEAVGEQRPVGEAGERVVEGLVAQLVLEAAALGDVVDQRAEVQAAGRADRPDRQLDREASALAVSAVTSIRRPTSGPDPTIAKRRRPASWAARLSSGMIRSPEPPADRLVARIPEGLGRALVPVDDDALDVHRHVGGAGRLDDLALLLLARADGRLGGDLGGDVHQDAVGLQAPVRQVEERGLVAKPDLASVAVAHAERLAQRFAGPKVARPRPLRRPRRRPGGCSSYQSSGSPISSTGV